VTSDKCYLNHESGVSYHEEDPLGGKDPYSASKAAAEIVIASYRSSYFGLGSTVSVSSARAGNVLGGGDWATDRILPDCVRSLRAGLPIRVRNPTARRPWQHVLESASGYLWLGAALASASGERRKVLASGFNFGPEPGSDRTVEELVGETLHHWPGTWDDASDRQAVPEAGVLRLDIAKAARVLGWRPVWPFERSVREAVRWYREFDGGRSAQALMAEQISAYTDDATESNQPWAK
jgi:CDP-glucose 4,6-dehydratase